MARISLSKTHIFLVLEARRQPLLLLAAESLHLFVDALVRTLGLRSLDPLAPVGIHLAPVQVQTLAHDAVVELRRQNG